MARREETLQMADYRILAKMRLLSAGAPQSRIWQETAAIVHMDFIEH
jgi:hypothetical protein